MKKVIFAIAVVFCFSSCKKCYKCSGGNSQEVEYCKGSIQYEQIKQGTNPTDVNGTELHCY